MAFSWQEEKKKEEVTPSNFSWGSEKAAQSTETMVYDMAPRIPGLGEIEVPIKRDTPEQQAAKAKIEAYNLNSPIGFAKESVKGLANPFIAAYEGAIKGYQSVEPAESKGVKDFFTSGDAAAKAGGQVWADAVTDLATRWDEFFSAWKQPEKSGVERESAFGRLALGGANVFFAPISGTMKMLSSVPVVGYAADKVEQLFAAIGGGGGAFAVDVLQNLPIAADKKKDLEPVVEETAAFIAMIAAGKGGEFSYKRVKTNVGTILNEVKAIDAEAVRNVAGAIDRSPSGTNPPVQVPVTREPTRVPVQREGSPKPQKGTVRQAYDEPYIPDSQLPVIEAGRGSRSNVPTIQADAPKSRRAKGDLVYEPIEASKFSWNEPKQKSVSPREIQPTAKQLELVPAAKPKGEALKTEKPKAETPKVEAQKETFQSETSTKFREEAQRRGIDDVSEVPTQTRRKKVDDWRRSDDFVQSDTDRALRVVKGFDEPPTGMLREDIYKSLELRALEKGDTALVNELIPLRVGTEAGRGLQALNREIADTTNPIEVARRITEDRVKANEKQIKKEKAKTKEIEAPKKDVWEQFISEISC